MFDFLYYYYLKRVGSRKLFGRDDKTAVVFMCFLGINKPNYLGKEGLHHFPGFSSFIINYSKMGV